MGTYETPAMIAGMAGVLVGGALLAGLSQSVNLHWWGFVLGAILVVALGALVFTVANRRSQY
jgi:CDP-diglyceride synthetase